MQKERLNIYLDPAISSAVRAMAGDEEQRISKVAEELITLGLSIKSGEVIEQQSLPIIREIVQNELLKGMTQLRLAWREDMQQIVVEEMKAQARKTDNRLAGLLVRGLRDTGIVRRLVYSLLAKAVGQENAQKLYNDAKENAGKELARPVTEEEK